MSERIYKRREVRERLKVTKYGYRQLIAAGILEKEIRLSANAHPFHTESQLQRAEARLFERAAPQAQPEPRGRSRGMSRKVFERIQSARS